MFINSNNSINLTIKFTSADKHALYNYVNKSKILFLKNKLNFTYTILPHKTKRFYLLRSPHVYKKSIETFEQQIYTAQFKFSLHNYNAYLHFFSLYKFIINNIPLNIKITINLHNNVQTNLL